MPERSHDAVPERRENWAEAEFRAGACSVITLRSGHVLVADEPPGFAGGAGGQNLGPTPTGLLVAAFAADVPTLLNRIAGEMGVTITRLRARVHIAWNPLGIAGVEGIAPVPFEARTELWMEANLSAPGLTRMRSAYERRCPLYNLFVRAGCQMVERWTLNGEPQWREAGGTN